jgi:hypothetical protein
MANPFSPRSGTTPPYLIDRADELDSIERGLVSPYHDPSGNILVTGLRGTGKTVLLNKARDLASEQNWAIVDTYLSNDLLERVNIQLDRLLLPINTKSGRVLTGVQVASVGGIDSEMVKRTIDAKIEAVTHSSSVGGLLITIDEVHATSEGAQSQLGKLGNEIQLAQRRNVPVMAVMAGLPGGIAELLKDRDTKVERKASTFLRRADKMPIANISDEKVWAAYRDALNTGGKFAAPNIIDMATDAAKGYPYLFQLIGFHIWQRSESIITTAAARFAIDHAKKRLGQLVHDTALADLSAKDKTFLLAMAGTEGPAKMSDIAEKLHITKQNANATRRRLIDAEMIERSGHGLVEFSMPYLQDFLKEHAAAMIIADDDW